MKKRILILLLGALVLLCLFGCDRADSNQDETTTTTNESTAPDATIPEGTTSANTPDETTTPDNNQNDQPTAEGELDKDSQIIRTLTQYLIWYGAEIDRLTFTFPEQIDFIKEGSQAVHAVFDPSEYYFVCGYYNPTHEYEERNYCCVGSYTWIKYESETEIQEYYNGMKCVVAFQLNESLTVTDILSADADVPHMEYFQLYEPAFKDETNTEAPIIFDGTFIYINVFEKDAVYYCLSEYYDDMSKYFTEPMIIPCEYVEGQYYIPIWLISLEPDEIFNLQDVLSDSRFEKAFGEYYDAIIKAINTEKWYEFSTSNEKIHYYGLISIDDFADIVLGNPDEEEPSDELIERLIDYWEELRSDINPFPGAFVYRIRLIQNEWQPLCVTFNPNDYYFVCGYNLPNSEETAFSDYVWVKYDNEIEIQEYYNGGKIAVAFQVNKALTVTDILCAENDVPNMEHFLPFETVFENGVNVATPKAFDDAFIYLQKPNQNGDVVYYSTEFYEHSQTTIPFICLDDQCYISILLTTSQANETVDLDELLAQESFINQFGEYYDAIISVMDTDKYRVTQENGDIVYYGLISFEDFVNSVLK